MDHYDADEAFRRLHHEHMAAGGRLMMRLHRERLESPRPDADRMTDEQKERVAVWIKDGSEKHNDFGRNQSTTKVDTATQEEFRSYAGHHFAGRWGVLSAGKREPWYIENPDKLDNPTEASYALCDMCRHLDFEMLFKERGLVGNNEPGAFAIGIYGITPLTNEAPCSFCDLIRRKVKADGIIGATDDEILRKSDMSITTIDADEPAALQLCVKLKHLYGEWPIQSYIIRFVQDGSSQPWTGNHVGDMIEATVIKSMLSATVADADFSKLSVAQQSRKPLRFVDVLESRIVTVDMQSEYACLSYVWGDTKQVLYTSSTRLQFESAGALLHESIALPQTLLDAIRVCRLVGMRYLWIDALCILQDDASDKIANVERMSEIYGGASFTIIACTNTDPNQGLPGVSQKRKISQIRSRVREQDLVIALHDPRLPLTDVKDSVWNTRAWTLQERQLSRRQLYFTESQCVLVTPRTTIFEEAVQDTRENHLIYEVEREVALSGSLMGQVLLDPGESHHPTKSFRFEGHPTSTMTGGAELTSIIRNNTKPLTEVVCPEYNFHTLSRSFENSTWPKNQNETFWTTYRHAVVEYSARKMTSDTDAINAFQGLMARMKEDVNMEFWAGLPNWALSWALLWQADRPLRRRRHPGPEPDAKKRPPVQPSWSWAAWDGPCRYRGRGWYNNIYFGAVPCVRWCQQLEREEFLKEDPDAREQIELMAKVNPECSRHMRFITSCDSNSIYSLKPERKGWEHAVDLHSNQHYYTHDAYPNRRFDLPVPLPNESTMVLPYRGYDDTADPTSGIKTTPTLHFATFTVPVRFVEVLSIPYDARPRVHNYIQIGLNDHSVSANRRPLHNFILYHQGYRCGILNMNVALSELELPKASTPGLSDDAATAADSKQKPRYVLAALSRDRRPEIQSSRSLEVSSYLKSPSNIFDNMVPLSHEELLAHANVVDPITQPSSPSQDQDEGAAAAAATNADEHAEGYPKPDRHGQSEDNQELHVDYSRFVLNSIFPIYNVLFLERVTRTRLTRTGTTMEEDNYQRIGSGRIHHHALHHAGARVEHVNLE